MSETILSPEASPSAPSGVRRANNWPLYILGALVIGFLIMMMLVAMDRANRKPAAETEKQGGNNSLMSARDITSRYEGGIIAPKEAPKPLEPPKPAEPQLVVPIARPDLVDQPPVPPRLAQNQGEDEKSRFRQMKLHLLEEAIKAKTQVQVTDLRGSQAMAAPAGDSPQALLRKLEDARNRLASLKSEDPNAAYLARMAQLKASGLIPGDEPQKLAQADGNDFSRFDGEAGKDRWQLASKTQAPHTPYELRAGAVLPATMISGVNSNLAGQIMAQVSNHVFDTATGKHLLIPQGARLVGAYSNQVAYGQERVLIAWQRIVFPDGKALDIGAMPGADSAGYAGFADQVDHHYPRIFGSALMMSLITGAISYSQQNQNQSAGAVGGYGYQPTAGSTLSSALGQQLGQATAALLMKNLNVAPTIEIRPGFRFNVMVSKDMAFDKPYRPFDYPVKLQGEIQ